MSLIEAVQRETQRPGGKCKIPLVRAALPDAEQSEMDQVMADRAQFTGAAVARALKARGFDVSEGAVNRHRNKICGCRG